MGRHLFQVKILKEKGADYDGSERKGSQGGEINRAFPIRRDDPEKRVQRG